MEYWNTGIPEYRNTGIMEYGGGVVSVNLPPIIPTFHYFSIPN